MALLTLYVMTGLLFFAPPDSMPATNVKRMLEEFLSQGDLKEISNPALGELADRLDVVRAEPVAQVREILPLSPDRAVSGTAVNVLQVYLGLADP